MAKKVEQVIVGCFTCIYICTCSYVSSEMGCGVTVQLVYTTDLQCTILQAYMYMYTYIHMYNPVG